MLSISSDDTTTDNDYLSWYVLERERASRAENIFFIYSDGAGGEWHKLGPSGDDDILHSQARLAALVELYQNRIRRRKRQVLRP